ncbi:H-NS histone family protein [Cereibacter sp. SYSU M97828]|nr:H-NS histone family protein [Cereibacter flavus]
MMIDLNSMSLAELKSLQKEVAKAIQTFEKRRKAEAVAILQAAAKEQGFSLAELIKAEAVSKSTLPPKFANPADPSDTWSGRGRRPRWFAEALEAGKTENDLLI